MLHRGAGHRGRVGVGCARRAGAATPWPASCGGPWVMRGSAVLLVKAKVLCMIDDRHHQRSCFLSPSPFPLGKGKGRPPVEAVADSTPPWSLFFFSGGLRYDHPAAVAWRAANMRHTAGALLCADHWEPPAGWWCSRRCRRAAPRRCGCWMTARMQTRLPGWRAWARARACAMWPGESAPRVRCRLQGAAAAFSGWELASVSWVSWSDACRCEVARRSRLSGRHGMQSSSLRTLDDMQSRRVCQCPGSRGGMPGLPACA